MDGSWTIETMKEHGREVCLLVCLFKALFRYNLFSPVPDKIGAGIEQVVFTSLTLIPDSHVYVNAGFL